MVRKEKSDERAKQLLTGLTMKNQKDLTKAAEMMSSKKALGTHASAPESAFDDDNFDEEDMPRGGGGCFGGCFGSSAKKHQARAGNGDVSKRWEVGADSLPAIESATPEVTPQRSSLHGGKNTTGVNGGGGGGGGLGANREASSRGFGAVTNEQDMGNESESP